MGGGSPGSSWPQLLGAQPSDLTQGGGGDCSQPNPPYLTCLSSRGRSNTSYVFVVKASLS